MDFVVSATGARAAEWREVFGTDQLPVRSMIPEWASAPGIERALFYQLDLETLAVEQLGRLVRHTAAKFGLPVQQVRDGLLEHGMPLLAEGLSLTVYHPQRWLDHDYPGSNADDLRGEPYLDPELHDEDDGYER